MLNKSLLVGLSALLVLGLLAGCGTNRPMDEQLDDAEIVARVNAKLAEDTDTSALNIDVDSMDGVVTLSGVVQSDRSRLEAERLARTTRGVVRVISRLRVDD